MVAGDTRDTLTAQIRKGALEYCILALLAHSERYGYELVRRLSEIDGMVTTEGTVYPILSRLRRDGSVDTTWHESASGPPRRYYRITQSGREALAIFVDEWRRFQRGVDQLLEGHHDAD